MLYLRTGDTEASFRDTFVTISCLFDSCVWKLVLLNKAWLLFCGDFEMWVPFTDLNANWNEIRHNAVASLTQEQWFIPVCAHFGQTRIKNWKMTARCLCDEKFTFLAEMGYVEAQNWSLMPFNNRSLGVLSCFGHWNQINKFKWFCGDWTLWLEFMMLSSIYACPFPGGNTSMLKYHW